jgi:tRNA G18 (ribose-2'-O)-methylase SpoU
MMRQIILIAHNVRSAHNVGSLLRTADGLGIKKVIFSGYTPYPVSKTDVRLPHISQKLESQIHKTALGAEQSVTWEHIDQLSAYLNVLRKTGFEIAALEQTARAVELRSYIPPNKIALVVGNEITGIEHDVLNQIDIHLQIRMLGQKESFNVSIAAGIALYHLRHIAG